MPTVLDASGTEVRCTPVHRFSLPPRIPGRFVPQFNGNGQYRLPDPDTGKMTSWTRASTVAKAMEETYMLELWRQRQILIGMHRSKALTRTLDQTITEFVESGESTDNLARSLRSPLNAIATKAQDKAGSGRAAEFGTAVHAWCEWVDLRLGHVADVPEMFRPWVEVHLYRLADAGLSVVREYTERIVVNTRYRIAGTLDRIYFDAQAPSLYKLGDIKTSRGMDYSWMYFAIQLAIYQSADYMLSLDGSAWEPMTELDDDVALISWLPSDRPEEAAIVPLNLIFGREALHQAVVARKIRSRASKEAQSVLYTVGSNPPEVSRWFEARFRIETSRSEAELAEIWEQYRDVWTDSLTTLGLEILQLVPRESETPL